MTNDQITSVMPKKTLIDNKLVSTPDKRTVLNQP